VDELYPMTQQQQGRTVIPPPRVSAGLHVEAWRGPDGELVVVPIGADGRILTPTPIYIPENDPAALQRVTEQFERGALPGQRQGARR
jgi:hypothetical protein